MTTSSGTDGTKAGKTGGEDGGLSPFRVLGVALVLDQLGKEARMAFRYPTSLNSVSSPENHQNRQAPNEELFFTLSSRQMAKLFRPKHSLCGQAMTLAVGGTVFCFRAVLMGDMESNDLAGGGGASSSASITSANTQSTNNSISNNNSDHLVLFSVIVALAPRVDRIPISGWFEGKEEDKADLHRVYSSSASLCSSDLGGRGSNNSSLSTVHQEKHLPSASFLAIRRVQLSLARLCRVLEREEKRCRYISLQSYHMLRIRAEVQKKWEKSSSGPSSKPPASSSSPKADFSSKGPPADRKKNHRRGNSFGQGLLVGGFISDAAAASKDRIVRKDSTQEYPQEKEQEILEHVLALRLQGKDDTTDGVNVDQQHGNLGRELVHVFHALSRNDWSFPPSPSVLSGRDGVVYVNRHIAVAMEAASLPRTLSPENMSNAIVRPYHTLIFPNASPSQLLQALQSSGFTAPLQQLLLMVRPSKPLTDIAVDANLPLSVTMELANYLVSHGACVASTVLTRASRLACKRVDRIQELALDFSQTFDDWSVSLFLIVSFLTTNGRTLGDSMTALTATGEDDDVVGASLRAGILSSMFHETDDTDYIFVNPEENGVVLGGGVVSGSGLTPGVSDDHHLLKPHQFLHTRADELEEVLYSMAIWLLSHQVVGHIQDYLVLPGNLGTTTGNTGTAPTAAAATAATSHFAHMEQGADHLHRNSRMAEGKSTNPETSGITESAANYFDDSLLPELHESDCLIGNASILAISWRLDLDDEKLRSWALRHDKLRIVSRVAAIGDDWGAV